MRDVKPTETQATILLVEDDPGDQVLVQRTFEEGEIKTSLQIVEDGVQALDYLLHRGEFVDPKSSPRPDLILLDLNLPKLDGKQVLEKMRAHPDLRRIPVAVLTTSKREDDIVRSYDLGVNSYVTKSVDLDRFLDKLRVLTHYWFNIVVLPPSEE